MAKANEQPSQQSTMHGGSSAHLAEQISRRVLVLDLDSEIAELQKSANVASAGRAGKTIVKHPDLRIVLTAIRRGTRIAEHEVAGRVSVQTLRGKISLHPQGKTVDLPAGHMLVLDCNIPHNVTAAENSAFLVSVALPPAGA